MSIRWCQSGVRASQASVYMIYELLREVACMPVQAVKRFIFQGELSPFNSPEPPAKKKPYLKPNADLPPT